MDRTKRKNQPDYLRRYWFVFLSLMLILALMMYFPLRIKLDELLLDIIFYGTISIACLLTTVWIYRRYAKQGHRLIVVIVLCALLSSWQVFDLAILRTGYIEFGMGNTLYYATRFPDDNISCHMFVEQYIGNDWVALTRTIWRDGSWFRCGG